MLLCRLLRHDDQTFDQRNVWRAIYWWPMLDTTELHDMKIDALGQEQFKLGKTLLVVDMFRRLLRQQALRTVWSAGGGAFRGLLASPSKMRGPQITVTDSVGLFGLVCRQDQFKFMNSELQKQADLLLSQVASVCSCPHQRYDIVSQKNERKESKRLRVEDERLYKLVLNFGGAIAAGRVAAWIALSGCEMIWMVLQWSPF